MLSSTTFAQKPNQDTTKPFNADEWAADYMDTTKSFKKEGTTTLTKKEREEVLLDLMRQFDESDKGYWGGNVKKYGNPIADSLGLWLNKLKTNNFLGIDKPNATPILGADKMDFYKNNLGRQPFTDGEAIRLEYYVTNKNWKNIYKEIKKAFAIFIKDPSFKLSYDNETYGEIFKNNLYVFYYNLYKEENGFAGTKLILLIQNPIFPKILMLDETNKNNISTTIKDTDKPQIWEVRGYNNGEWYQRYNGIFKDGILVNGSKTFKGYGNFYDGTWYSPYWLEKDWVNVPVFFYPANSKDTVLGSFNDWDMNKFDVNTRYDSKQKNELYKPEAPKWVTEVFANLDQNDNRKQHENIAKNVIRKTDEKHLAMQQNEKEFAIIKNMQQNLFLLIGTAALGFKNYKMSFKAKDETSVFYVSKPNPAMLSNEEVIEEIGSKKNYTVIYRTKENIDLSMKAFMALPSVNKSSSKLTIEQENNSNATEVQRFNLFMAGKLVANYTNYSKEKYSIINIFQLSF